MRLSQAERKEKTRAGLVETAREVFLERGFHGASLDEIAERAGYSKGAVYSNFAGKDELFLAVLDANFERRLTVLRGVVLDEERLEDSYRAVGRSMVAADEGEPRWTPLLLEFWGHASRHPVLRAAVAERRERFFTLIAELIEELGARHGVTFALPAKDIARGSNALARGVALDRLLTPGLVSADTFVEMHNAYVMGLTRFEGR
jgi:AcrR family transcriptional regulator